MFVERYRDVAPAIRSDCVTYLGEWVTEYPSIYAKNNCLRMLGWALSDRSPEVRIAAVEALTKVYSVESMTTLDMFTEAFKGTY
jgi:hypothetical protein